MVMEEKEGTVALSCECVRVIFWCVGQGAKGPVPRLSK